MTIRMTTALAAIIALLWAQPARSDDCDDVMSKIEDVTEIAGKAMELEIAEITKDKPQTDSEKLSLKNRVCSAFGEFLGVSRAAQLAADECLSGNKRRNTVASMEKSIKDMEKSILDTCQ
jgi:hypothetical protein